nr:HD domain-containing protein [Bacteroidota bacterium]
MNILAESENYITGLFKANSDDKLRYHNIEHTKNVVKAATLIAGKCNIKGSELEALLVAAWFHDVGYLEIMVNHEDVSKKLAREFLEKRGMGEDYIQQVERCIEATRVPQNPADKAAAVLCDADLYHLSQDGFMDDTQIFWDELSAMNGEELEEIKYLEKTLKFFKDHQFKTEYGRTILEPGKETNLKRVKKALKKRQKEVVEELEKKDRKIEKLSEKVDQLKAPQRGVESMFRLTANNQITLSSIADNKANILITVNSIIISVVVTMLVRKFSDYPTIVIPTMIFLLTSLITIVFAILSTRPKVSGGTFTREDIRQRKINLLFFGNFYKMGFDDYEWAIKDMMKDYEGLYRNMILDQYSLGKVLAKKYKRLRIAYNVFMFGLVISVIAFSAVMIWLPPV